MGFFVSFLFSSEMISFWLFSFPGSLEEDSNLRQLSANYNSFEFHSFTVKESFSNNDSDLLEALLARLMN